MFLKSTSVSLVLLFGAVSFAPLQAGEAASADSNAKAASTNKADALPDPVLAKGKGVEVKRSQFDEEVIRIKTQAASHGQTIPPEQMSMLERQVLDELIQMQLLSARATDADKAAGKESAQKEFEDAKTRLGSEEALNRQFKLMGTTREDLLARLTEQGTAKAVLKRELKASVTDEDVKKYYDENPSRFEQPEKVRAAHILISTKDQATQADLPDDKKAAKKKLAEDVLKRARGGEDFVKLVKEYSDDPGSKDKGGEYTFPRGQMVPEFEAAAFSLKTNEISDLVTTQYGYHIIKVLEKFPAKKMELAQVASDLKEGLASQAMQKQFPEFIAKCRKEAAVEILDDKLKQEDAGAANPRNVPINPNAKPGAK